MLFLNWYVWNLRIAIERQQSGRRISSPSGDNSTRDLTSSTTKLAVFTDSGGQMVELKEIPPKTTSLTPSIPELGNMWR
jgi:hypothetical protein